MEKMTKAETSAWLVGQFVMAEALIKELKRGHDLDATLNECLVSIMAEARKNDQMALMFSAIDLRRELAETVKESN